MCGLRREDSEDPEIKMSLVSQSKKTQLLITILNIGRWRYFQFAIESANLGEISSLLRNHHHLGTPKS